MAKRNTIHYLELLNLSITFVLSPKCCRFFLYSALVNYVILQYLSITKIVKYDVFDGGRELCQFDKECLSTYENSFMDFPSISFGYQICVIRLTLLALVIRSTIRLIKDFNVEVLSIKYLVIKIGLYICIQTVDWMLRIKLIENVNIYHYTNLPIKIQWYKMTLDSISTWLLFIMIIYIYLKQIEKTKSQEVEKRVKGYIAYETFTEFYANQSRR